MASDFKGDPQNQTVKGKNWTLWGRRGVKNCQTPFMYVPLLYKGLIEGAVRQQWGATLLLAHTIKYLKTRNISRPAYLSHTIKSHSDFRIVFGLRAALETFVLHENSSLFSKTFFKKPLLLLRTTALKSAWLRYLFYHNSICMLQSNIEPLPV